MMEKDYQPDGWLGFIVGAKYWISFTERKEFTISVEKLLKEINLKDKSSKKVDPLDEKMVLPADPVNEDTGGDGTAMMPNSSMYVYMDRWMHACMCVCVSVCLSVLLTN